MTFISTLRLYLQIAYLFNDGRVRAACQYNSSIHLQFLGKVLGQINYGNQYCINN